jgi:Alkylmercury lyase
MPHRIGAPESDSTPGARGTRCSWPGHRRPAGRHRRPGHRRGITYRIGEDGAITGASHPGSVLSFLRPGQPWGDDVMTTFCHYVLRFTGPATAQRWTAAQPGTFVMRLGDAAGLARPPRRPAFGAGSA